MIRYFLLCIFKLMLLIPISAIGAESIKVSIAPFKVFAQENLSYLQKEIPSVIGSQLEKEGAQIVIISSENIQPVQKFQINTKTARSLGLKFGVDYFIWGSITQIGTGFSLDVKTEKQK